MFGVEVIRDSDVDGIELLAFAHRRYAIECLDAKFGLVLFARLSSEIQSCDEAETRRICDSIQQ